MKRTTKAELEQMALMINGAAYGWLPREEAVGPMKPAMDEYFVQWAYGQPRLMRAGGSVEVSPRLPAGQLRNWLSAFHMGIITAYGIRNGLS